MAPNGVGIGRARRRIPGIAAGGRRLTSLHGRQSGRQRHLEGDRPMHHMVAEHGQRGDELRAPIGALDEHVEFARRRKFIGQPFQLCLDPLRSRVAQRRGKQRDRGPQAAQAYPHLMHALRIEVAEGDGPVVAGPTHEVGPGDTGPIEIHVHDAVAA